MAMGELELTAILCSFMLGGETEVRHSFDLAEDTSHIRVDCETETHVYEVGLDNRVSSYDSVHQAMFAAALSGKIPAIILIDTNGIEENEEFRIETAARLAGVSYGVVKQGHLVRLQMTWPFRAARDAVAEIGAAGVATH